MLLYPFVRSKDALELDVEDVKKFLNYLAVEKQVSASSQNQAFNGLLFLYRGVTICMKAMYKKRFAKPRGNLWWANGLQRTPFATPFATALLVTCSLRTMTSAPFRNSWGTVI